MTEEKMMIGKTLQGIFVLVFTLNILLTACSTPAESSTTDTQFVQTEPVTDMPSVQNPQTVAPIEVPAAPDTATTVAVNGQTYQTCEGSGPQTGGYCSPSCGTNLGTPPVLVIEGTCNAALPSTSNTTQTVPPEAIPQAQPVSPLGTPELLGEWGVNENEPVNILVIETPDELQNSDGVESELMASYASLVLFKNRPGDCREFWLHIFARHIVVGEFALAQAERLITALANGTLQPELMGASGAGTKVVVKVTFEGAKWLLFIGSALLPTLYIPSSPLNISKALQQNPKIQISNAAKNFVRSMADCLIKNKPPAEELANLQPQPAPIPTPTAAPIVATPEPNWQNLGFAYAQGFDASSLTQEEIVLLIGLGVIVVVGIVIIATATGGTAVPIIALAAI